MLYLADIAIGVVALVAIVYMLSNKAIRKLLDDEVERRMKD